MSDQLWLPEWQQPGCLAALWPTRRDVWRADAKPAQEALLALLAEAAQVLPVVLGVNSCDYGAVKRQLPTNLPIQILPYNDSWLCDTAPFWCREHQQLLAVNWSFAAWQGLYNQVDKDIQLGAQLAANFGIRHRQRPLVLEGGNLTTDGAGTGILVQASVQSSNRQWSLGDLTREIMRELGLTRLIWLGKGLLHDETGGHIDNMALFLDSQRLLAAALPTPADPNYQSLQTMHTTLRQLTQPNGQPYELIEVPAPFYLQRTVTEAATVQARLGVKRRPAYEYVLASYVNVVILPGRLLVPQFGVATDAVAVRQLQQQLPDYQVIGVQAREFVLAGGGPHCLTHIIPKAVLAAVQ